MLITAPEPALADVLTWIKKLNEKSKKQRKTIILRNFRTSRRNSKKTVHTLNRFLQLKKFLTKNKNEKINKRNGRIPCYCRQ